MLKENICSDCGDAEIHRDSKQLKYCRYCAEKAGHTYLFKTTIDHDKLRDKVGGFLATKILKDCKEGY